MVQLELPAKLTCDFDGCTASAPIKIVLLTGGGLGVKDPGDGWQIAGMRANPFGPMIGRCAQHQVQGGKVEVAQQILSVSH